MKQIRPLRREKERIIRHRIKSQQEEWDALGEDGQKNLMEQKEALEAEDADEEESAAIIKEH